MFKMKKLAAIAAAAVMAVSAMAVSVNAATGVTNEDRLYTTSYGIFTGGSYIGIYADAGVKTCSASSFTQNVNAAYITAGFHALDSKNTNIPYRQNTNTNNSYSSIGISTYNLDLGIETWGTHELRDNGNGYWHLSTHASDR